MLRPDSVELDSQQTPSGALRKNLELRNPRFAVAFRVSNVEERRSFT
jgi:hypothetical protein